MFEVARMRMRPAGFSPGRFDGRMSEGTANAIRAYQSRSGMPVDGVELLRFLSDEDFRGPVLIISGFDRRVLESAFRLGEALGLTMAGPLEKPVRLEELENLLKRLKPVVPS